MILTPLDPVQLPGLLECFDAGLAGDPVARAAFRRIAGTLSLAPGLRADLNAGRAKAVDLARRLGIPIRDADPADGFSWNGAFIAARSETSVVFHEIAHWQIAPAARRRLFDFGLGAGPETGRIAAANAARCADAATQEDEENLASLLGILWEAEHGEPAIIAFAEQNWLELPKRAHTHRHFAHYVGRLAARGLLPELFARAA
ncbi:MAG: hypothetical protein SFV21_12000 [Rhodospirillaceae bacterium]|nr:hypothetical protein [Rhodospirillaceae bacterium]